MTAAGPAPPPVPNPPVAPLPPPTAPPVAPLPPRSGDLSDQGAVVRPSVRARSWTVAGRAKVLGPVELDRLQVRGDLAVAGTAKVDQWDADGHVTVDGAASGAGPWSCKGEHRFGSTLSVQGFEARGRVDLGGTLTAAQAVNVEGTLDVQGDVRAASVAWRGAASISGEVRANSIHVVTHGASKVGALRAPSVRVEHRGSRFAKNPVVLEVLEVEGKEVYLAGVVAQYVRADRITVGPGCRLTEVNGTVVGRDASSHIGPQSKSPKPHGLSR